MTQIAPPVRRRHAATRPPQPLPPAARWQAALSAFTLLALIAGVPAVLVTVSRWPIPHQLPSWEQVGQALLRPDDGTLLVTVLLAIAWIAWALFTISVAAELPAVLRGRRSRRIPGLRHVQGLAAQLVASALVLLPSVTTSSTALAAPPPTIAATAALPLPAAACGLAEATATTAPPALRATDEPARPVYVVRGPHDGRRDTLWTIAADHLGDPLRWHEIADLNLNKPQPDGGRLTDPHWIRPGWRLLMPADATGLAASPAPALAKKEARRPTAPAPRQPAPAHAAPSTAAHSLPATPNAPQKTLSDRDHDKASAHDDAAWEAPVGIAGAGVLAAGLLTSLAALRRRQRRHRRPGERISPTPPTAISTEVALRVAAEPDAASLVARAIDALAPLAASGTMPTVATVEVAGDVVHLAMTEPTEPAPPFAAHDDRTWRVSADDLPDPRDDLSTLLPALVTVGHDNGREVLINLERCSPLVITGDAENASRLVKQMALQLATAPWANGVTIHLVGADPDLAAVSEDRLQLHGEVTEDLANLLEAHATATARRGAVAILRSRLQGAAEPWPVEVLLVARSGTDTQDLIRLHESAGYGGAVVTAGEIASGHTVTLLADGTCRLDWLHRDLQITLLPPTAREGMPALFEAAQDLESKPAAAAPVDAPEADDPAAACPEELSSDVRVAAEPLSTAPDDRGADEDQAEPAHDDLDERVAAFVDKDRSRARVQLFGEVRVFATGPMTSNRLAACTETVALLASHPNGVTTEQYDTAVWPDRRVRPETRHEVLARTRKWLGEDQDGEPLLPHVEEGRIQLSDDVLVDWRLFQQLVDRSRHRRGPERLADLEKAISLVTGPPFAHVPRSRYQWLVGNNLEEEMTATFVDAANELAEARLNMGDLDRAKRIAKQVQSVDRADERSWRTLLRVESSVGSPRRLRDTIRSLLEAVEVDSIEDLTPETAQLAAEALTQAQAARTG